MSSNRARVEVKNHRHQIRSAVDWPIRASGKLSHKSQIFSQTISTPELSASNTGGSCPRRMPPQSATPSAVPSSGNTMAVRNSLSNVVMPAQPPPV